MRAEAHGRAAVTSARAAVASLRMAAGSRGLLVAIAALCSLTLAVDASAQSLRVQASLSDVQAVVGDLLTLEITAVSTTDGTVTINVPKYAGVSELSRRSSESSQFSITNARRSMKRTKTLVVEYEAAAVGKHTLTGITARSPGGSAAANPVVLVIGENAAATAVRAKAGQIEPPRPDEAGLFVRFRSDKAQAYLGEQIVLDLEIFTNGSFNLEDQVGLPTLDGFWNEIIEQPKRLNARNVRIGRNRYRAYRLWRAALFPLQAGLRPIVGQPLTFSKGRSMFKSGARIRRSPTPLTIDVIPLPTEGRPSGFSSTNVGEYRLTARIDQGRVPAGKAVVLKVRLEGRGNIKSVKLPKVERVDGFRVFPATVRDEVQTGRLGLTGHKESEQVLMPLRGGRLEIPALELPVFSPKKGTYETLRTRSIRLIVDGDPQAAPTAPTAIATEPSTPTRAGGVPRAKLRPLRYRSKLESRSPPLSTTPLYAGLIAAPPLLFLFLLLLEGLLARARRETPTSERKKAARAAHARLATARHAADDGDATKAYGEIQETLYAFTTERTGVPVRGLTMDEARGHLSKRGMNTDLIDRIISELEHCDFARFAPGGKDAATVSEALERASTILAELEAFSGEAES